ESWPSDCKSAILGSVDRDSHGQRSGVEPAKRPDSEPPPGDGNSPVAVSERWRRPPLATPTRHALKRWLQSMVPFRIPEKTFHVHHRLRLSALQDPHSVRNTDQTTSQPLSRMSIRAFHSDETWASPHDEETTRSRPVRNRHRRADGRPPARE